MTHVAQRFPIPVLLTYLNQITSSLEERYVHELCSDWHATYTVFFAREDLLGTADVVMSVMRSWSVALDGDRREGGTFAFSAIRLKFAFSKNLYCTFNPVLL